MDQVTARQRYCVWKTGNPPEQWAWIFRQRVEKVVVETSESIILETFQYETEKVRTQNLGQQRGLQL